MSVIAENFARVLDRIAAAADKAGRPATDIQLVGVTKYVAAEAAIELWEAGCRCLGESRPQELWRKAESLSAFPIEWHLIGHLQTNKIRRTLPHAQWIHAVDSVRLLSAIDEEAANAAHRVRVLLEVNVSGDANKHGFSPDEAETVIPGLANFPHLEVSGLMTMASLQSDTSAARSQFAQLRELRDRWQVVCPEGTSLEELSMGMTRDFEPAIQEGATMVRVGSALFEGMTSS